MSSIALIQIQTTISHCVDVKLPTISFLHFATLTVVLRASKRILLEEYKIVSLSGL